MDRNPFDAIPRELLERQIAERNQQNREDPSRPNLGPQNHYGLRYSSPLGGGMEEHQRKAHKNFLVTQKYQELAHQEKEAAQKALDHRIAMSAETSAERTAPSARDFLNQHIARNDNIASKELRQPERLTDVSRQTLSVSSDALPQRENAVTISSDHATHENLRRTGQRDLDITRTDYQEIGRGLKREELKQQFKETAREVTAMGNGPEGPSNGLHIPPFGGGGGSGPDRPPPSAAAARSPEGPDKGSDRLAPATVSARNHETSRAALNQHIERTEKPNRTQMREAARETLRRHMDDLGRGQTHDQNRDINRPRGLER